MYKEKTFTCRNYQGLSEVLEPSLEHLLILPVNNHETVKISQIATES